MPSEPQLNTALRDVVEFTEGMGNSIEGEAEGQTEDGRSIEGYQVQHGDHTLAVVTAPGWDYFTISYRLDILQNLAVQKTTGGQPVQGSVEINQMDIHDAFDDLEDHVLDLDIDLESIRIDFARTVAQVNSSSGINIDREGEIITGFQINTKFFPFREGFDINEYAMKMQETVTAGWIGTEFLMKAYNLDEFGAGEMTADDPAADRDMFQ